jgi:hypothetical protein
MALMAQMAKERGENEAFANSPLAKQNRTQADQLAAQGQQMQSNARLQRLMQLGQESAATKGEEVRDGNARVCRDSPGTRL